MVSDDDLKTVVNIQLNTGLSVAEYNMENKGSLSDIPSCPNLCGLYEER